MTSLTEQKQRLLVVEDEEALLSTLQDELQESGFLIEPAITGEEALRKVENWIPDGVLLDVMLAGDIDGLGVLARLKQDERVRNVPVVMLTNVGEDDSIREALALGADAYFVKTRYSLQDLIEHLKILLPSASA